MHCPRCLIDDSGPYRSAGVSLLEAKRRVGPRMKVSVHRCENCGGLFCAGEALDELIRSVWTRLSELGVEPIGVAGELACPACSTQLEPAAPAGGHPVIERCPSCDGFWLDAGELDELRKLVMTSDDDTLAQLTIVPTPKRGR